MNNTQEAFNRAVAGVIKQGRPSVDAAGRCLYRGPDGLRCAVGWLIPDELYEPEMEGVNTNWLRVMWPRAMSACDNRFLVRELQEAHDWASMRGDFLREFKKQCRGVAARYGLDPAVIDK